MSWKYYYPLDTQAMVSKHSWLGPLRPVLLEEPEGRLRTICGLKASDGLAGTRAFATALGSVCAKESRGLNQSPLTTAIYSVPSAMRRYSDPPPVRYSQSINSSTT